MPIAMKCQSCAKQLSFPDHAAGKKGKCPACGCAVSIPAAPASASSPKGVAETTRGARRPPRGRPVRKRNWGTLIVWGVILLVVGGGGLGILVRENLRNQHLNAKLSSCAANGLFDASAQYAQFFSDDEIIFEIRGAAPNQSPRKVDAVHLLFQFAHEVREQPYSRMGLVGKGRPCYLVTKEDLNPLAHEYTFGNPIYSIRKWPSILHHPDGKAAFGEWTGGVLGVLGAEMKDVNTALEHWIEGGASTE